MRIAITGSTGLIGKALVGRLLGEGHDVVLLTRRDSVKAESSTSPSSGVDTSKRGLKRGSQVYTHWDPVAGVIDRSAFDGVEGVIHLAGEPIAAKRWSHEQKMRIMKSRVNGTKLLSDTLASLEQPPASLVTASAVGWYGDRGDEILDETSSAGDVFLSAVCIAWEAAALSAKKAGIRVCHARTGIVLSTDGGALAQLITPFSLGLGGRVGNGKQWMSWIAIEDVVSALAWLLTDSQAQTAEGPVNLTAPNPVTNAQFTSALGQVLRRPTFLPTPKIALDAKLGSELAEALLYSSTRVHPTVLQSAGFKFTHTELVAALKDILNK